MGRFADYSRKSKQTANEWCHAAPSKIHRNGLFARRDIPAGTLIAEYDGPRLPKAEGRKLAREGNVYVFALDRKTDLDGSVNWNLARHANHSCAPNAKSVKVDGRIWLKALKEIKKGEEIAYDYGYDFEDEERAVCLCGAPACAGFIVRESSRKRLG